MQCNAEKKEIQSELKRKFTTTVNWFVIRQFDFMISHSFLRQFRAMFKKFFIRFSVEW